MMLTAAQNRHRNSSRRWNARHWRCSWERLLATKLALMFMREAVAADDCYEVRARLSAESEIHPLWTVVE